MDSELFRSVGLPVVTFVAGWLVEFLRTKSNRKHDEAVAEKNREYERAVQQRDAVSDMSDSIQALSLDHTHDPDGLYDDGIVNWEQRQLPRLYLDASNIIVKARRYSFGDGDKALYVLGKYCYDGSIEVAKGHTVMMDAQRRYDAGDETPPDLTQILTLDLWFENLKVKAERCVGITKRQLEGGKPAK